MFFDILTERITVAKWLALQSSLQANSGSLPGRARHLLAFQILTFVDLLFKTSGGETEGLILLFL